MRLPLRRSRKQKLVQRFALRRSHMQRLVQRVAHRRSRAERLVQWVSTRRSAAHQYAVRWTRHIRLSVTIQPTGVTILLDPVP